MSHHHFIHVSNVSVMDEKLFGDKAPWSSWWRVNQQTLSRPIPILNFIPFQEVQERERTDCFRVKIGQKLMIDVEKF